MIDGAPTVHIPEQGGGFTTWAFYGNKHMSLMDYNCVAQIAIWDVRNQTFYHTHMKMFTDYPPIRKRTFSKDYVTISTRLARTLELLMEARPVLVLHLDFLEDN